MLRRLVPLGALASLAVASPAFATIDSFIDYYIPYFQLQTGDICLMKQTLQGPVGVPPLLMAQGIVSQTQTLDLSTAAPSYVNINLAATEPALVPKSVDWSIDATGLWKFSLKLDAAALSAKDGSSDMGRSYTVYAAKLFLVSLAESLDRVSSGKWQLALEYTGLPPQAGLKGVVLPVKTSHPYSAQSPVLAAIRAELVNTLHSCGPTQ